MIAATLRSVHKGLVRSFGVLLVLICIPISCASGPPNIALGARCTIRPLPTYPLTCSPGDSSVLTDGKFTSGHFWTSKTTAGWEQSGPVEILLDLGGDRSYSALRFSTARGTGGDVYYPAHVFVFAGNRADSFSYLGDAAWSEQNYAGGYETNRFSLSFPEIRSRYVLLRVIPQGEYLFCDEIEVLGSPGGTTPAGGMPMDSLRNLTVRLKETAIRARLLQGDVETMLRPAAQGGEAADSLRAIRKRIGMSFPQDADIRSLREKTMAIRADLYRREHPGESLIALRVSPWIPLSPVEIPDTEAGTTNDLVMPRGGSTTMGLFLFNAASQEMTVKFSATVRDTTVARCRTSVAGFITAADLICTPDPLIPRPRRRDPLPG